MDIEDSSADEMDVSGAWPNEPSHEQHDEIHGSDSDLESEGATQELDGSPDMQSKSSGNAPRSIPARTKSGSFDNEDEESDDDTKETTTETGTRFSYLHLTLTLLA